MSLFSSARNALAALPVEGRMPGFDGAAGWLNSEPLTADGLAREGRPRGFLDVHVHQLASHARLRPCVGGEVRGSGAGRRRRPYAGVPVRSGRRERRRGREGPERRISDRTRPRLRGLGGIQQPVLAGRRTSQTRKDGSDITSSERADTKSANGSSSSCCARRVARAWATTSSPSLLTASRHRPIGRTLRSPETYVGYQQAHSFASPGGADLDEPRAYDVPDTLKLNSWGLSGEWTVEGRACVLNRADGRIAFRFHARDVHLVMR